MKKPLFLNENIIYLCGEFTHQFNQRLAAELSKGGLHITPEQFFILTLFMYTKSIGQKAISEKTKRDKTTIARIIKNMQKNNLVIQVTDENDHRSKLIHLTDKGRFLQSDAMQIAGKLYSSVLNDIGENKIRAGNALLRTMIGKI